MTETAERKVVLNEREYSWEKFLQEKARIEQKKGVTVIEVSPNTFKTRING